MLPIFSFFSLQFHLKVISLYQHSGMMWPLVKGYTSILFQESVPRFYPLKRNRQFHKQKDRRIGSPRDEVNPCTKSPRLGRRAPLHRAWGDFVLLCFCDGVWRYQFQDREWTIPTLFLLPISNTLL